MGERRAATNKMAAPNRRGTQSENRPSWTSSARSAAGTATTPGRSCGVRARSGWSGCAGPDPRALPPGGLGPRAVLAGRPPAGGQAAGPDAGRARPRAPGRRRARPRRGRGPPPVCHERGDDRPQAPRGPSSGPTGGAAPSPRPAPCARARSRTWRRCGSWRPSSTPRRASPSRSWASTRTAAASSSTPTSSSTAPTARSPSPAPDRATRPGNKNDGAEVEQKSWTHVCELVGYLRFDSPAELRLLNRIWDLDGASRTSRSPSRSSSAGSGSAPRSSSAMTKPPAPPSAPSTPPY